MKGTEPLAFLLNCFVVVETKGEMQFRARCFNIFAKQAMRVDILYTNFCGNRGRSLVLTWCCGWPWRLDATETPELAELRPNPRSAKCIYDGISLHMYFASTRILKGTEPLAFLLNCFVVVETKGEMQFRAKCVKFVLPSEPWALIIYTQTGSSYVRTFHGIVVEALNFQCLCRGFES